MTGTVFYGYFEKCGKMTGKLMCLVGTKLCSMWYQTFVLNEPKPELRNSYQVGKHIERVQKMHLLPDRRNEKF